MILTFLDYQFCKAKIDFKRILQKHICRLMQLYEKKSINLIERCFLMVTDNIGLHGVIQAYRCR